MEVDCGLAALRLSEDITDDEESPANSDGGATMTAATAGCSDCRTAAEAVGDGGIFTVAEAALAAPGTATTDGPRLRDTAVAGSVFVLEGAVFG